MENKKETEIVKIKKIKSFVEIIGTSSCIACCSVPMAFFIAGFNTTGIEPLFFYSLLFICTLIAILSTLLYQNWNLKRFKRKPLEYQMN